MAAEINNAWLPITLGICCSVWLAKFHLRYNSKVRLEILVFSYAEMRFSFWYVSIFQLC